MRKVGADVLTLRGKIVLSLIAVVILFYGVILSRAFAEDNPETLQLQIEVQKLKLQQMHELQIINNYDMESQKYLDLLKKKQELEIKQKLPAQK